MKKFYNKPTAELVDFSLSTNIATYCAPGSGDSEGEPVLPAEIESCGGSCYHVSAADNNVTYS